MTIKCESCGTSFFVPNTLAGKRVKCRKCGQAVAVGTPPPAKPLLKPKVPLAEPPSAPVAPAPVEMTPVAPAPASAPVEMTPVAPPPAPASASAPAPAGGLKGSETERNL